MKKLATMAISVVLIACMVAGGSLAYLQDSDSDVNVMTLGNVKIEQIEQEWNSDKTDLVDFTQAKPLLPYVGIVGWENEKENDGAYRRFTMNNVVDKYVSVKNTGKSDAYVRTVIALEMGDLTYDELGGMMGISINKYNGSEFQFEGAWDWTDDFVAEIDGKNYNIMVAVHQNAVKPGDTTIPSLLQVYMNKDATNETCEKIDGNDNGTYDILVLSQAVQSAGFEPSVVATVSAEETEVTEVTYGAQYALDTAFGDVTVEKVAEWFNEDEIVIPEVVASGEDVIDSVSEGGSLVLASNVALNKYAIANGEEVEVEVNLNGKTITVESADDAKNKNTAFVAQHGASITINGDGIVDMNYTTEDAEEYCMPFFANKSGTVIVNGGTYNMGECEKKYHIYCQNSGTIIINDGKFITSNPNAAVAYCINGFIEINGGFFQNTANSNQALLSMGNNLKYINNQKITLSGGTFVNWNPMDSAFARAWTNPDVPALIVLADGYKVVSETQDNGDIWYIVVAE